MGMNKSQSLGHSLGPASIYMSLLAQRDRTRPVLLTLYPTDIGCVSNFWVVSPNPSQGRLEPLSQMAPSWSLTSLGDFSVLYVVCKFCGSKAGKPHAREGQVTAKSGHHELLLWWWLWQREALRSSKESVSASLPLSCLS